LVVFLVLIPAPNIYFRQVPSGQGVTFSKSIELPSPPPYPVNQTGKGAPETTAVGVVIKDTDSGVVLYRKNEKMKFPPASTTKIVTAMVALDKYKLDDVLTVKTVVGESRTMGLISGEKITAESLLYGTLVHSANDAAYVLAENYPGGVDSFVGKMNEKVKSLHLLDTHFVNPVGFDDPKQYTTAADLVKLAEVALANKTFAKIVSTKSITVSDVSFTYFHDLRNVNQLLGKVAGVAGVKTGFTQNAGEVLISEVKRNDRNLIIVVLKSNDRFDETTSLMDWVFGNFVWIKLPIVTPNIPS
jgi:D-alanyl-D-alanine carboxypeptidase